MKLTLHLKTAALLLYVMLCTKLVLIASQAELVVP